MNSELKQAIWNIFPGDIVRLRLGAKEGETAIVKSVRGSVVLESDLDGCNHWEVSDLVVVKKRSK
jgi:hypothetical protein